MSVILNAVFPIFGLIALGYLSARRQLLGPGAIDSLNKFVSWMALPALLFQAMAQISWDQINQPGYIAAFSLSTAAVFILAYKLGRRYGKNMTDASLEGLCASYTNSGFMGIPLCLMLLGDQSLPPAIIATLLTACVLFASTIAMIEIDQRGSGNAIKAAKTVGLSLIRNPLVTAPIAGIVISTLGIALPGAILQFATLLGAAASPCALITIGLFLAQSQTTRQHATVARIVGLKLFLHPLLTFVLVYWVFIMPPMWAAVAVLLSALPIGTGPFMIANLYGREATAASSSILISTVVSILTLSAIAAWLVVGLDA
jgi:malonate transporter